MSRKSKYTIEQRVQACEDYLNGTRSLKEICTTLGTQRKRTITEWAKKYEKYGVLAFQERPNNKSYTKEFKLQVIEEYISTQSSLEELIIKYNISSTTQLRNWISVYNANRELTDYSPKREVYMAEARRKTTIEERKEIVEYCINHERNYKDTASLYDVSYSQVYSWVKKYDANGEDSLIDKRGHHKTDDEVDELERLRRENLRLKRQLEEKDMLAELLKKVKEFERM
jgi:transposase-like protein